MRGMIPWPSRTPPAKRWYREKWSRAGHETPIAFFILGNPLLDLFLAERTRRRHLGPGRTEARSKKQNEFLLLFGTQLIGRGLDFG